MSALLVTGSSGFIGSALLPLLRAAVPARPLLLGTRLADRLPADGTTLSLDLATERIELPSGIGTVVHLAGEKRDPQRMVAVNHRGAAQLVEAAARAGVRRFVHLSSVGVYGAREHAGVVDESSARTPRNAYEASKNDGEIAVRESCAALGLDCIVLQPSNVIGIVAGRAYPLLGLARAVGRGWFRHVGRAPAWVNYVALEDVAAALVAAAADDAAPGVFIVNTPAPLRDLVGWIAEELGRTPPTGWLPSWVGPAAAAVGAIAGAVLRRDLPISPERMRELTNTTRFDGGLITRKLGFAYPLGIEACTRAMMQRYRREGLL